LFHIDGRESPGSDDLHGSEFSAIERTLDLHCGPPESLRVRVRLTLRSTRISRG
jgi:hypothetical protein